MALSKEELNNFMSMSAADISEIFKEGELRIDFNKSSDARFEPTPPPIDLHSDRSENIREQYRFDLFETAQNDADNIKKSASGNPVRATKKKKKADYNTIINRLKALGLACLIAGGAALTVNTVKEMDENSLVTPHVMSFRQNVIGNDNIHRTYDNQYYYYDYDDIAEYLKVEGQDFSRRLFIVVEGMGVNQADRVLEYVPGVNSVEDYVRDNNFEDIEDWKENEVEKFRLERSIRKSERNTADKKGELSGMFSDTYEAPVANQSSDSLGGTK